VFLVFLAASIAAKALKDSPGAMAVLHDAFFYGVMTAFFASSMALLAFYLAWRLMDAAWLPGLFGLEEASFYARALLLAFVGFIVAFPLTPLSSLLSRRHEWQADRFASELTKTPEQLATALAKLARDNLSNLHPHPLYARFYYSHPPVVERLRRLRHS